jgi:hypothetical protein
MAYLLGMKSSASTGEAMVNVVRLVMGKRQVAFRVTKHQDSRVTAERSNGVVWKPIGGLQAARNQEAKLKAEGFKVVAAA